jgi:hypothetical protein
MAIAEVDDVVRHAGEKDTAGADRALSRDQGSDRPTGIVVG